MTLSNRLSKLEELQSEQNPPLTVLDFGTGFYCVAGEEFTLEELNRRHPGAKIIPFDWADTGADK